MNVFSRAQLRLTVFYVLVLLFVLVSVDAFANYNRALVVYSNLPTQPPRTIVQQLEDTGARVADDLRIIDYPILLLITLLVGGMSYFLARSALRPIDAMVRSQQRFLANAAHELRTPLTLLRTETELATRNAAHVSRESLLASIRNVAEESEKMTDIINNLLLISSTSLGKQTMPFIQVNLTEALERAIRTCTPLAQAQQVALEYSPGEDMYVRGNLVALEQIATNLIGNAIAHTPAHGTVTVSLRKSARMVRLAVEDTGVGIPADELPHIFDPFFKGSRRSDRKHVGTGLGLPIVQGLVEMHGGWVHVASEPDKGTRMQVTLPNA